MVWYSHLFQNFPQFIVVHTVKGFGIVNKEEIDVFLLWKIFCAGFQVILIDSFSVNSCNFGVPTRRGELSVFLLHYLGHASIFILIPKKDNAKECSNYHTIALIPHASKVMLKILQARLQQYVIENFQMLKNGLEKPEELEIK